MSEQKLQIRAGEIEMRAEGEAEFVHREGEAFIEYLKHRIEDELQAAKVRHGDPVEQTEKTVEVANIPVDRPDVKCDVVAIYDNAGIPSFMYRFKRVSNKELFGGGDKPHPAFVIGGEVYDEIFISVYENCEINGKPYSLPYQSPWTGITNDEAAQACFSKGEGWHLMTAAEWGLVANICKKEGTLPHGNTYGGRYHADPRERGKTYDGGAKTLTGSGPATWTHNHKPDGIHDLCGNVDEMVRGLRIKNGMLQKAKDNDAALDIDLTTEGDGWENILDDSGKPIRVSVDGSITFTTDADIERDYNWDCWGNVRMACKSEQLRELALYPGEPRTYCLIDSTEGEYFPVRGGCCLAGENAGVFFVSFGNHRSDSGAVLGFRSAYFRKYQNTDGRPQ